MTDSFHFLVSLSIDHKKKTNTNFHGMDISGCHHIKCYKKVVNGHLEEEQKSKEKMDPRNFINFGEKKSIGR